MPGPPIWTYPYLEAKVVKPGKLNDALHRTAGSFDVEWLPPMNTGGTEVNKLEYELTVWENDNPQNKDVFSGISLANFQKDENRKNFNDLSIKSFSENGIRYRVGLNEPMKDKYVKFDTQYRIEI